LEKRIHPESLNVLCGIIDGTVRAKVLYEDDLVVCLDLPMDHPVRLAPVHFLVIPREHLPSAREIQATLRPRPRVHTDR
jgi:diadenosine tetraphosphate (Ap4A) HIT family hydrolase